jgi:hypothetical protein
MFQNLPKSKPDVDPIRKQGELPITPKVYTSSPSSRFPIGTLIVTGVLLVMAGVSLALEEKERQSAAQVKAVPAVESAALVVPVEVSRSRLG